MKTYNEMIEQYAEEMLEAINNNEDFAAVRTKAINIICNEFCITKAARPKVGKALSAKIIELATA